MGGGVLPSDVFLNEIHYDNDGVDSGEFIEVVVSPAWIQTASEYLEEDSSRLVGCMV
jgi:hypothetical protein